MAVMVPSIVCQLVWPVGRYLVVQVVVRVVVMFLSVCL